MGVRTADRERGTRPAVTAFGRHGRCTHRPGRRIGRRRIHLVAGGIGWRCIHVLARRVGRRCIHVVAGRVGRRCVRVASRIGRRGSRGHLRLRRACRRGLAGRLRRGSGIDGQKIDGSTRGAAHKEGAGDSCEARSGLHAAHGPRAPASDRSARTRIRSTRAVSASGEPGWRAISSSSRARARALSPRR